MPGIIIGLLAVAFGLWGMTVWWWSVAELLRGIVPIILIALGVVALAAGVTTVRQDDGKAGEDIIEG